MIVINAAIPVDDVREDFPQAVRQDVEMESWDEWRGFKEFHGVILWHTVTPVEDLPPMPYDIENSLDDSNMILAVEKLYYSMGLGGDV